MFTQQGGKAKVRADDVSFPITSWLSKKKIEINSRPPEHNDLMWLASHCKIPGVPRGHRQTEPVAAYF